MFYFVFHFKFKNSSNKIGEIEIYSLIYSHSSEYTL